MTLLGKVLGRPIIFARYQIKTSLLKKSEEQLKMQPSRLSFNKSKASVRFESSSSIFDETTIKTSPSPSEIVRDKPAPIKPVPTKTASVSASPIKSSQSLTCFDDIDKSDPVQLAKAIFFQSLEHVKPTKLIYSQLKLDGSLLKLGKEDEEEISLDLSQYKKKYVVGFGKACLPMAESLSIVLTGLIDKCIISVPVGTRKTNNCNIRVHRGAQNNIPDEDSFEATKKIVELVKSCTDKDLLIVLISGGGSALLSYPMPPITLEEKQSLIKKLSRAGCTINELNTVRKRLSMVKGGGLVKICKAGKILSLIISDVADSPLGTIASGPTVENLDSPEAALGVIGKYKLQNDLPESIQDILSSPPPNRETSFDHVINYIVGENQIALDSAAFYASKYGLSPFIVTANMSGEAANVGYSMANAAEAFAYGINIPPPQLNDDEQQYIDTHFEVIRNVWKENKWPLAGIFEEVAEEKGRSTRGLCLLFGGETTVTVRGKGKGGRNQELVLSAGIRLDHFRNHRHVKGKIAILSAGTDGFDGPNAAAGAVVEEFAIHNAQIQGFSPMSYLKDNNSFNFFQSVAQGKYHIICGHTETNVMDMVVIVILKKSVKKAEKGKL